ncbi:MAG: ABC transporter substrate-binding protein [Acidipropionibacterium sp.]|jgi:NitT/TauT family transport system substrate-binding protein|nr:ABC transporter substrate-binding protein [Acidipropionibacterium sp.]
MSHITGNEPPSTPSQPDPQNPATLPSGAVLADDDAEQTQRGVGRRTLITGVVAAAGGLIVGGGIGGLIGRSTAKGSATGTAAAVKNRPLSVIYGGDVCDAPAIVAKEKGFFTEAGLDVTLHRTVGDEDIKAAVGSGQFDASSGIFYSWLKPVEQGQNVKFVAGLHSGCLRLVVPKSFKGTVANLKGATIGIPSLSSSATMFFSMDLLDAGINPLPEAKQVTWKVLDPSTLADALRRGQVDAIATSDPIAFRPILDEYGTELASNMSGMNAQEFCCCTALNGDLVKNEAPLARKLIEAWCRGSRYVAGHEAEVARIEVDKKYVAGDVPTIEKLLRGYGWKPSVVKLKDSLLPGIEKFKKTGYLDASANPQQLADKAFTTLGIGW